MLKLKLVGRWSLLTLLFSLLTPCWGNTLSLEFAQQGEPNIPRALVVIHNTFEERAAFKDFFTAWADRSWARKQYCSVYSYEYRNNGLTDLKLPAETARDLYAKMRRDSFDDGDPDTENPARLTYVGDERQPGPSMRGDNLELILVGSGYGGLVARETALLAKAEGIKVKRVGFVGAPLDGASTLDLLLTFTNLQKISRLGITDVLNIDDINRLSDAWWHLTELHDQYRDWSTYFAPMMQDTLLVAGYGSSTALNTPTDNVLYGSPRRLTNRSLETDGLATQPSAWGKITGPVAWLSETELKSTPSASLTEALGPFVIDHVVETEIIHGYLVRRQVIEETIRGDGEIEPIGVYWDEREHGQWRNAYASAKGLYEQMWGVAP